ncbi:MAG: hypothetical protein EXS55_02830, partial [Candidatus Magasanikbacteria bacterium]|nr:hypothetical protein [Candidatus Magasanikbacteria bacterium]
MEDIILKLKSSQSIKIVLAIFLAIVLPLAAVSYSPFYTHPDLTEQMARLFNNTNQGTTPVITNSQINWLRQGAIDEDQPPRWINHFFDPVHDQALSGKHAGTFTPAQALKEGREMGPLKPLTSVNWATNQSAQVQYRQFGNQTWQKAISSYLAGDESSAFLALGHILHLVEDASVPDHTRDDVHSHLHSDPGSPFEDYAEHYTNTHNLTLAQDLVHATIPTYDNVQYAFKDIADYSNHNFFSEDTISNNSEDGFNFPDLKSLQEKDGYLYDDKNDIYLSKIIHKAGREDQYTTNDKDVVL